MSSTALKRKRPEPPAASQVLAAQEQTICELILSRGDVGIWSKDIKQETGIPEAVVNKCLRALMSKNRVKEVLHKGKKIYMGVNFEPSEEVSGGHLYTNGSVDKETVEILSKLCVIEIHKMGVGTVEDITTAVRRIGVVHFEVSTSLIQQLVTRIALRGELIETRSTGNGEFSSIRVGAICYKGIGKNSLPKTSTLASIPCGVCPHTSICTRDGLVSPSSCVYFDKWLEF